ncbi:E3 ubiquitin-protein ligase Topors-like [Agrilus planipennis]|uniref:E3 ubiquitin-protein ligase Topors n=1 Tax=Agrilus planipennis TaxID=224129 RepID=A0A7F5R3T5_AGRPL|nr:E3 ubiquitin-protein ligase Topors-like [Agrilus planipennis]
MAEVTSPKTCRSSSASPPPKCAICLGTCTNKCYSNSCMHQFCFTCLLKWSKVKAECPLCKQAFKSIIHNIKSNSEYDEHIIARPNLSLEEQNIHNNPFLFIPPAPPRHFQFRTTFTVDPRGELAIQQMLLSHPLTNNFYIPGTLTRRASSSTSFRRSIYAQNLWVYAPPDITGQYRNISPSFFRYVCIF